MIDEEYEDEEALLRDIVRRANANIEKIEAARGKEGAVETVRKMIDGASVVIGIFQDADEPFGEGVHAIKGQRLMKSVLADGTTRRARTECIVPDIKARPVAASADRSRSQPASRYQEVYDALRPKLASTRSRRALVETSLKAWRATATEIGRGRAAASPARQAATPAGHGRSRPKEFREAAQPNRRPGSLSRFVPFDVVVDDLLCAATRESDRQLRVVNLGHGAVTELRMRDVIANGECTDVCNVSCDRSGLRPHPSPCRLQTLIESSGFL